MLCEYCRHGLSRAQNFPTKTVRYIVPFGAGGSPDIQQRLNDLVVEVAPTTREEFDQFIRAEIARWAKVLKDAGIAQQ